MRVFLLAISLLTTLLLGSQPGLSAQADEAALSPYKAIYKARYNGMDVKAVRELQTAENGFIISSNIEGMLGSIREQEDFHIDAQGDIQPDRYRMKKSFLGIDREEKFDVDPDTRLGIFTRKDQRRQLTLEAEHLGPVSYQLQLRRDLETAAQAAPGASLTGKAFSYPVFSRGKIRDYPFEVLGEEETSTGAGTIPTLKLQRVRDSGKRKTLFWVAPAWNFMIVKIQQREEDGEQYEMVLEQVSINGAAVSLANSN